MQHLEQGTPALLKFDHDVVIDGADLDDACNYALLQLCPPAEFPIDPERRAVMVVDPRAGHGPGIGGFKLDSEVGMAMRAGHPVYFVTFRPEPVDSQTLWTVMRAEARFLQAVIDRHPGLPRPVVIGNCQAGWAMLACNANRPELFGPLMVMGAPASYWAGGSKLNPMRYSGASLGGSWLASLTGDLGANRFDGAHLVENFERLNPSNTLWGKYDRLWSQVDTEADRFLEFERWWGGYFRMTTAEIEAIVENLFVGNRLARGAVCTDRGEPIDLRAITAPIVVFASWGDNITPPPQALNWIIDCWGDERAIAAAGRTIVYVLHDSVGHLGIFVGAEVARKEHDQLVSSLDVIESLPPGLYEMKLRAKSGDTPERWDTLEPGAYSVHYEHRTMDDLRAINPEGRDEEALFSTIAQLSEAQAQAYKTWVRPWLRLAVSRASADALGQLHPMRLQRALLSDRQPWASAIHTWAAWARQHRVTLDPSHPLKQWERFVSGQIVSGLDAWRDQRDAALIAWTRLVYGPQGLGAWLKPQPSDEQTAQARALRELELARSEALGQVSQGGFAEAVCRLILAGMVSIGAFERRSLRLARLLAQMPTERAPRMQRVQDWVQRMQAQARITAVAPVEALNALETLLPDADSRQAALAVAAAVMMIEPQLAHPRSEIIEFVMATLGVDPQCVIHQACALTAALSASEAQRACEQACEPALAHRRCDDGHVHDRSHTRASSNAQPSTPA